MKPKKRSKHQGFGGVDRREQLLVDAVLGRETPDLTPAEAEVKRDIGRDARAIRRRGGIVDIPADIPDIRPKKEE